MQGFRFRSMVGEHYAVFARKWLCTATILQHDAVSAAAESNGPRKLALAQDGQTKQQQLKDAHITKSLCRIMESQVWGPNTEPLLKPYVSDLSPNVVANVVLKQKSLAMAKQFFQWSGHVTQHNAHAYHALLMKLGEAKQFNEMWKLLHDMREKGSVVCGTTFSILLKAYGAAGLPHQALNTIKKACEFDVPLDTHVYTTLLGVLFRAKMADQARSVYKKMLEEKCKFDGSVWSTLIRGFGKNGLTKDAEKCWEQMLDSGCQPALIHFNALIEGLCESKALNKAVSTLETLQKKGLKPNAYTFNPILAALCKVGRFSEASSMFSDMRGVCAPNQATCNMLLEGLFLDPDVSKAVELYNLLEREGWVDSRSYLLLAAGLRKAKQTDKLSSVSEELHVKYGVVNVWLCNALLYCHCDQSNMDEAVSYFDRMLNGLTRPDVVSFATMINGYCKSEKLDDAMKLLSEMDGRGHKPNAFCYTPLIGAVLKAGRVADGLRLFEEMLRRGLETNAITCNVLLRNLSKAGMADESLWLCNHVIDKRFYLHHATLASLVDCLKKVGRLEKASAVFGSMEKQGCLVDGRPVEKALKVLRGTVPFETTPVGCYD